MNTMQPLNKILFLLDEISACKQRLSLATEVTRDIEIAVLQAKTVELFAEIQQYNRQALQPSTTQIPVNHYNAVPLKEAYSAPKQENYNQSKPEPVAATKIDPVAEKPVPVIPEPVAEAPQLVMETPESSDKQPKPIHPQSNPNIPQNTLVKEEQIQPQTPKRDATDFEKKREKLLREEEENKPAEPVVNLQPVKAPFQETKQPEPVQPKPAESKAEPVQQISPQAQPEIQNPENIIKETPLPQAESPKPEPAQQQNSQPQTEPQKQSVSQLYAQARERSSGVGTEKSLNEKLATQQTSLNDKFQSNVKKNLADKLKLSPISDLRTAININQRVAFINKLFKGDDKEFKNVVGTVNGFKNFSEAKFYIQSDIAPRFNWNEQDENVQEFMELVYRKFL